MKNRLLVGAALAASLLLSACGGDTSGTATTSSTTSAPSSTSSSSSAATTSETTESMGSSAMETMESSSDDSSSTVEPASLDEQTTTWFSSFCGGITGIGTSAEAMSTQMQSTDATKTPAELQATFGAAVSEFGNKFKEGATAIGAVPPPTIEGGSELASGAVTAFTGVGDTMIAAAEKFKATPVTDEASFTAAATTLQTEVQTGLAGIGESLKPLESVLTPDIEAAVKQIPGCEDIANS